MKLTPKQREFKRLLRRVSESEKKRFNDFVSLLIAEAENKTKRAIDLHKSNISTPESRKIIKNLNGE